MTVPFLDLKAQYHSIKDEAAEAIRAVLESCEFAGGSFVASFEERFADYCGTRYAVGVGSGTEAIWLTLLALDVGPGDEVITVPATFIATAEAISFTGAKPVFVDVTTETGLMAAGDIEHAVSPRTRAVIPVHLYGQTADMDPIMEIASRHGLPVVEDAAQAHGARYKGKRAGSIGTAGCFSFYPGKNLGAFGEAGAVTTDDAALAARLRHLRDHGQVAKYRHEEVGWNARMDGLQAAILSVKLARLDQWNEARRKLAALYTEALQPLSQVEVIPAASYGQHIYHIFSARIPRRDAVKAALAGRGIACGVHYPVPVHLSNAYEDLGYHRGDFPQAELLSETQLSLPMYAEMPADAVSYVADALESALAETVQ